MLKSVTMYARKDPNPRLVTPGFEHLNNFVLFDDGGDVYIKRIDNDESLTTNLVQYTKAPLSSDCTYYTMTIQELTEGEFVMFGLTNKCVPGNPMWIIDRSVRYHSNDGGVFNGGLGIKTYHPFTIGDKVTCRLDYTGPDRSLVNFLKNDRLVYRQWVNLPPYQLYPTVGVSRTDAKLRVEWPVSGRKDISIQKDLPSNWFGWTGLQRDDETKLVTLAEPDTETERSAYNIQSPVVFDSNFNYFEIEVVTKSEKDGCQAIGLVAGNCEPFVMPGWTPKSIGYHNDDGGLYCDGIDKSEQASDEKKCGPSDVMGCGVVFPNIDDRHFREPILVLVYFTLNGQVVHKKRMRQPRGGFFPCVGFLAKDDSCKLNVSGKTPIDDIGDLLMALNSADTTSFFRCSEVIQFKELAPESATFSLTSEKDEPQLVQYTRYSFANVGDGYFLEVLEARDNTELQLGVSVSDTPMEGSFLGSQATTCGYLLKLGSIAMKEGMRPVTKWAGPKDKITCYLDFQDEKLAVLCFENGSGTLIGRATVQRHGVTSPLYGAVVLSSGPCSVRMDWSRSIYNTQSIDRSWGEAESWLRPTGIKASKNKLTLHTTESYSFAACVQCRQPMLTGSSFFSIRLLAGENLPGIGLSKATTDVNNLLGSDKGEVCFFPDGELLIANSKYIVKDAPTFNKGDVLQCGMIFAEQDRVEQKGVVFFARNDEPFFHCRFHMMHGGVYPTITFASAGCSAELLDTSRAQPIPEKLASEWLNEDTMVGVVPFTAAHNHRQSVSNNYWLGKDACEDGKDVSVVESKNQKQRIIYVSHTVRENERVEPFITVLKKHFLTCKFETSQMCVEINDKKDALRYCDFVVLFMSDTYSESHEMAMEYALFEGKPVLVAAHAGMQWPPQNYFVEERKNMERYPMVKVSTADVTSCVNALIRLIEAQIQDLDRSDKKKQNGSGNGIASNGAGPNGNRPRTSNKSAVSRGKTPTDANQSSTCLIL